MTKSLLFFNEEGKNINHLTIVKKSSAIEESFCCCENDINNLCCN